MYDYFDPGIVSCPVCGNPVYGFQTKDFECMMDTYHPGDNVGTVPFKRMHDRIGYPHEPIMRIRVYTTCAHKIRIEKIEDDLIFGEIEGLWIEYTIPVVDGIIVRNQNRWIRETSQDSHNILMIRPEGYTNADILMALSNKNKQVENDILITKWEQTHIGKAPVG